MLAGVAAIYLLSGFRIAQQFARALVFRLVRDQRTRGPGLFWVFTFFETVTKDDMRVHTDGIERHETMTKTMSQSRSTPLSGTG